MQPPEKQALQARSSKSQQTYQAAKDRAKKRSAEITMAGQDIAPMPSPKDPRRRARADRDFKFFCESYFLHLSTLEWSQDHLRVIGKIEQVVLSARRWPWPYRAAAGSPLPRMKPRRLKPTAARPAE